MTHSLLNVIEVRVLSARADLLTLPVRESICHEQLHAALDQRIRRAVRILVPAVRRAHQRIG